MLAALLEAASPLLATAFTVWASPVSWLEVVAFGLSLWMVWCNLRVDATGWPLAMISSLLYALLFANSKLYGEATLQLFFIAIAAWGWHQWLRGGTAGIAPTAVRRMSPGSRLRVALVTLAAWPLVGLVLKNATDSDVPFMDALPAVGSVTGQILLGRKLVENWAVWLVVNLLSVGLFAYKGLWLTVLLYAVFAVLSWVGWRAWQRRLADDAA